MTFFGTSLSLASALLSIKFAASYIRGITLSTLQKIKFIHFLIDFCIKFLLYETHTRNTHEALCNVRAGNAIGGD